MQREIIVIAHNIRSIHNVGSIFRTCEGFGVKKLILSGYTPAPGVGLPHVAKKIEEALHKTALGAESIVPNEHINNIKTYLEGLRSNGFRIAGLEQNDNSILLPNYNPPSKMALLIGEEVYGITKELIELCDDLVEIPMFGLKESFNVSVATGVALYAIRSKPISK